MGHTRSHTRGARPWPPLPEVETPAPPPLNPPTVSELSPTSGSPGDAITITGTNLTGATSVTFAGTSASFDVISDTQIIATVPNGATTGAVAVTNDDGTGTGPTFTVTELLGVDLSQLPLPGSMVAARTGGNLIAQIGATTAEVVATPEVFEDHGDGKGGGAWTFGAFENPANPRDLSTAAGWIHTSITHTADDAVAPDGTMTADKLEDASGGVAAFVRGPSTAAVDNIPSVATAWVKDSSPAPSASGIIVPRNDGAFAESLGTGGTWRRKTAIWKPKAIASAEYINIYPVGGTPAGASSAVLDPAATGAVHVWGAQASRSYSKLPVVVGDTGALTMRLAAGELSKLLVSGDLHIEGAFLMDDIYFGGPTSADPNNPWYLWSMETPNGLWAMSYSDQVIDVTYNGIGAGTSGWSVNVGNLDQNTEFRWELWSLPGTNKHGSNFWINGYRAHASERRGTALTIGQPTSFWLGSNLGASNHASRRHTLLRYVTRGVDDVEGVVIGDSIISAYSPYSAVASFVYTIPESRTRPGILSMAYPGDRTDQQLTKWQGVGARGKASVNWGLVQVGINDVSQGIAEATIRANYQAIVDDFNAQHPGKKLLLSPMVPCASAITAGQLSVFNSLNESIRGLGANPITGSNLVRLGLWTAMDDGSDNLIAAYDSGDGLHTNTAGRQYQAATIRTLLQAEGLL